jgi:hypothetical protein
MTVSSIFHVRSNPVFYERYKNHPKNDSIRFRLYKHNASAKPLKNVPGELEEQNLKKNRVSHVPRESKNSKKLHPIN